jgi:hypothetical protein
MRTILQVATLVALGTAIGGCNPGDAPSPALTPVPTSDLKQIIAPTITPAAQRPEKVWFEQVRDTGIDFRHVSGTNEEKPFPAANGSGLAAFDYDLDGRCDLYFATGKPFPIDPAEKSYFNRCYRNLGDWRFQDVTRQCGLGHDGYSAGVAVGDFDSDGFPDVFVACYGADVLYRNLGDGTFQRCQRSGVEDERWAASAALFDADNDGLLDLYVCHYAKWTWDMRRWCGNQARNIREYCSPHSVEADDDVLFRNLGDGRFEDATAAMGLARPPARGQGVVAADLDDDGLCDLYIGNDLHPNFLFMNQGGGKFNDATESSGAAYNIRGNVQAGMGVDAADVTGDGRPELFVTNFSDEASTLYDNLGPGSFQDATMLRGIYADSLPFVGWGTVLVDFNLDGWPDVIVTNGPLRADHPPAFPPLLFENTGGKFRSLRAEAGDYFTSIHDGRALAGADFDNDGDVDVVIGHHDGAPALLCNERLSPSAGGDRSITLRLVGTRSNRDCIGASIWTTYQGERRLTLVRGGVSYLSAHDPRLVIAASPGSDPVPCEIRWPGGEVTAVENLRPGGSYVIIQPTSPLQSSILFEVSRERR